MAGVASAALVGVEYLLRPSVGGQPQLPAPQTGPAPVPARRTIRQADAPRCFIFGRTRISGSYFLYETDGYFGDSTPFARQLYQGIYICDGPIDGWDAFICDDEAAPVVRTTDDHSITDGSADQNIFVFTSGSKKTTSAGNSIITYYVVSFEPVNATEAGYYPHTWSFCVKQNIGGSSTRMDGVFPPSSVGKGITCVYTMASMQRISQNERPSVFPSGFPEWSFCVRGARVYDPRDPSQSVVQNGAWTLYNATWKWSENPALIAAHFIMWLISQNLTAIVDVDWASIATAANDCDRLVSATMRNINNGAKGGATEPFARLTGTYYFTIPPREFLSQIMAACDGSYSIDKDGRFTMWIGKWEDPAVTFTESDVASFTEEFVAPVTEAVNEIHSTYVEPANAYQRYEAPVWRDEASVSKIGRRLVSIKYDLVPSANQAYRLSQRYARRINGKRKLQITLGPRGMLAFKQRVIGLNLPNFGIPQSTWRVEALQPDGNLTRWTATLRELTPDVFSDDPPDSDPAANLKIVSAFSTSAPSNFLVAKYASGPGASTSYVVVSMNQHLNAPDNSAAGIVTSDVIQEQTLVFEASYSTDGGLNYVQATTYLSNYIVRTPDIPNGTTVYVMCRYMNADGSYSAFSSAQAITL
ncbi:MAG: phage tail protein [Methylocystis sp.]|uniref:phage tail protein n=1 Tax=Methylocystis sp. TaxID=1911079 RepID=UPI003DA32AF6